MVLYGCESVEAAEKKRMFKMWSYRGMLEAKWTNRITIQAILKRA